MMYQVVFGSLGAEKQAELVELLEKAVGDEDAVLGGAAQEKSEAIKEFLTVCEHALRDDSAEMKAAEEEADSAAADEILKQL